MELVQFFKDYWQYISAALLVIIDVIILLVKKRPSSKDLLMEAVRKCYLRLPFSIQEAETECKTGSTRKEYVLEDLLTFIETYIKRELSQSEFKMFYNSFSYLIEEILSTPTKKGGPGREDEKDE